MRGMSLQLPANQIYRRGEFLCLVRAVEIRGIDGIHVQNAAQVQAIGADGICMMSDWMQAEEPEQLMQQLRAIKPEEQR